MSFKRKVKRTAGKVTDRDITKLLRLFMQAYSLIQIRIYKKTTGFELVTMPDMARLPGDIAEAYELTASYMDSENITAIIGIRHEDSIEFNIKRK